MNENGLAFSGDGMELLSASAETLALWDLGQADRLARVSGVPLPDPCSGCPGAVVSVSGDGRTAVALDGRGGSAVVERVGTSTAPRVLSAGTGMFGPAVFAAGSDTPLLPLASATSGPPPLLSAASPGPARWWTAQRGGEIVAAAPGADGQVVLVDADGAVRSENPVSGTVRWTLPGPRDLATNSHAEGWPGGDSGKVALDSSGTLVAILDRADPTAFGAWDRVLVRELPSGRIVGSVAGAPTSFVAYAGGRLLVQRTTGQIDVWDARGTRLERALPGDSSFDAPPVGSPDGTLVARQRTDGTVVLSDLNSGQTLAILPAPLDPSLDLKIGLGFSPSGDELLESVQTFAGTTPFIITRNLSSRALLGAACTAAGSGLTPALWRTFVGTSVPARLGCP